MGVSSDFRKMDINHLVFQNEEFDVIAIRNVTWTFEYPEQVYSEFKRILKIGGLLLIYDANWHLHFFDEERLNRVREREERYFCRYGCRELVAIANMKFFATAPLTSTLRPAWDKRILEEIGMDVQIQDDIGENVYEEWEKDLYGESPLFEICARKLS
ncbi:MAG: class I SAM-dependent methyltransferase [Velocimicrobium sp.]